MGNAGMMPLLGDGGKAGGVSGMLVLWRQVEESKDECTVCMMV